MVQDSIQVAVERVIAEARQAADDAGPSDSAMERIERALSELAGTPGLVEQAELRPLHGNAAMTILASEGPDSLTLMLACFPPDQPTPVHDHGSWGIAHVIAGRDRYVQWDRLDAGDGPESARVMARSEMILDPGDTIRWPGPPGDVHSQQGEGGPVWELVLFGRDPTRRHRRYFDPATGELRPAGVDESRQTKPRRK